MFFPTQQIGLFRNNDNLIVDFRPFIRKYKLSDEYILLHYNKYENLWGIYDGKNNKYYLASSTGIEEIKAPHQLLDVVTNNPLKCLVLYPNASISIKDSIISIVGENHEVESESQNLSEDKTLAIIDVAQGGTDLN